MPLLFFREKWTLSTDKSDRFVPVAFVSGALRFRRTPVFHKLHHKTKHRKKYRKRASNISLKLFNLVRMGGTWTPTSLRTLAPEDTIFVHITSCKMNRTSIKLDFCAEYALVWWKNAIINTEKFEKKPAGNRYILVENLFCRGIFAWKYNLLDTY